MKKITTLLLILNILFLFQYPCLAVNKNTKPKVSTFYRAIGRGDVESLEEYVKNGFDINQTYCNTSFFIEAINKKQDKSIDFLINNNANVNAKGILPPLYYSVAKKYPYAVKKLLEAGANQDEMYMGITAQKLAINKNYTEIIDIFENFNQLELKNATNLQDAINLLEKNPITKPFYLILMGENKKQKPFKIIYAHMSLFYDKNTFQNVLATVRINDEDYYICINENLKHSSKEALATLIASEVFHTDDKDSINEEAYSALTMATVWHSFAIKNPKLRNENSLLTKTLNEYENDLINNDYDLALFKNKVALNPTYKSLKLPEESEYFTNELLNLPKDKSIYDKIKLNMQKYWNSTTTSEKVYNICYFVAYAAVIIGTSYLLNITNYNTLTVQQSAFSTLRINSF